MHAFKVRTRFTVGSLLLLLCSLLMHSLDACASHVGLPESEPTTVSTLKCKNTASVDEPCATCCQPTEHDQDHCQGAPELSTGATHHFQLEAPPVIVSPLFGLPADFFIPAPPSSIVRSRDGPDVPTLVSLCQRSTLPGRSPPFSA